MISIKDRMPSHEDIDKFSCVLVKTMDDSFYVAWCNFDNGEKLFNNQNDYFQSDDVVSWSRLPE